MLQRQNKDSKIVFSRRKNQYIDRKEVIRHLKRLLKNTEYAHLKLHDLRHLHASLLLHHHVDLKTISTHLGHSSIQITADTYIQPFEESKIRLSYDVYNFFHNL
ncbi:tyrosine-type recombinase/integrase [Longibaculum muris]|uniref:tyrosine-type recombinase/integrase n=1 Tax=Longibaculum muris TaxID=1796628 RepID=UPI0037CAE690